MRYWRSVEIDKQGNREIAENYYFVPDSFDLNAGIMPIRFGSNIAMQGYHAGPRSVPYFSLHFVRSGIVELRFENTTVQLSEGSCFCLFPQQIYSYKMVPNKIPLQMTWIAFGGPQAQQIMHWIGLSPSAPYLRREPDPELKNTLEKLLLAARHQQPYYRFLLASSLQHLFMLLCPFPEEAVVSIHEGPENWIPKSIEYMKTHFGEPIGINDVAKHMGVHRAYFSKLFTEHTGINPSHYLRRLRMEQAQYLLKQTNRSVLDISLSLGYENATSFTRAFSSYFGEPPKQTRLRTSK